MKYYVSVALQTVTGVMHAVVDVKTEIRAAVSPSIIVNNNTVYIKLSGEVKEYDYFAPV